MINEKSDQKIINEINLQEYKVAWESSNPFSHIIIDNFLVPEVITSIVNEFPSFDSHSWDLYDNPLESKRTLNHYDRFGIETYRLFCYLNSRQFIEKLEILTKCDLYADFGLNGGGLHSHKRGGKLNIHLDYSIHPKLKQERRVNILIYVTPDWQESWGGSLGFWEHDKTKHAPGKLIKEIAPLFNRAVIFDTTQHSWHGLPDLINCPPSVTRNSLAIYYLCKPRISAEPRGKALFHPNKEQENDPDVLAFIKKRANITTASDVYIYKK